MFQNARFIWVTMPTNKRMPQSLKGKREKIIMEVDDLIIPVAWLKETRDFVCILYKNVYHA